jgi:hypothetical protein
MRHPSRSLSMPRLGLRRGPERRRALPRARHARRRTPPRRRDMKLAARPVFG